ncbi:brachyurin-like [Chironomus tepperi]|uniref:brachyurin-like n=1 Tax=Chironomus tepperi TaxID=113505 RepID=UPI00391F72AB
MKLFVLLLIVCATSAFAENSEPEIDWSSVKTIQEYSWFWKNKPALIKPAQQILNGKRARIVNGNIANPHQFPYQAGLLFNFAGGTALCGGALIHARNVLTAAHCVDEASGGTVILGAHFIRQVETTQQRRTLTRDHIRLHPLWTPSLIQNDIAVLHLPTAVTPNNAVAVIHLPLNNNEQFANAAATVSGWGVFDDTIGTSSDVLRFYRGTILPQTNCALRFPGVIQPSNICLSGLNNGGACSGDSGGPLTTSVNGVHTHIGVVSFGLALGCELLWPSVFARTSFYIEWIRENQIH